MRFIVLLAAMPLLGAAPPASVQPRLPAAPPPMLDPYSDPRCPETPMSLARKRGGPLVPQRLGELPPAQTFMAVDRRVAGCPAPMRMSELPGR